EEERPHHERVGGHGDPPGRSRQGCLILERRQHASVERGQKDALHEVGGEPPTGAVTEDDALVLGDRDGTSERRRHQSTSSSPRSTWTRSHMTWSSVACASWMR